jgi:hypothetical protein
MEPAVINDYFCCVGAQKSGTTWLARVLAEHPQIFVTPVKEIHYFDHVAGITQHLNDRRRRSRYRKYFQRLVTQPARLGLHRAQWGWYRRYMRRPIDDAWYRDLFEERAGKRFAGEATPEYALIGEAGFRHLQRLAPAARLVYIMRNPVSQAWSQLLHHCRANAIDAAKLSDAEAIAITEQPRVRALGDYAGTIDEVRRVFAADRLHLMFYEDVHAARLDAIAGVCSFIGADYDPAWFPDVDQAYNRSQDVKASEAVKAHLRGSLRAVAEAVADRAGRLPEAWRREFAI